MSIRFLDASAPGSEQTLYESNSGTPTAAADALRFERAFEVAGRSYRIVAVPTAGYLAAHPAWAAWSVLAGSLLFCGLLQAFLLLVSGRAARIALLVEERTKELSESRKRLALALEGSKRESGDLERRVGERTAQLEARQRESQRLAELSSLLQAGEGIEDAALLLPRLLAKNLAPHCGAVYLVKSSLDYLDHIGTFGESREWPQRLAPADCWALRRGQLYGARDPERDIFCAHVPPQSARAGYLCMPMQARGAPVGLLHVMIGSQDADEQATTALRTKVQRIGEQVAIGLANIRLREALREQSLRDPLTGLYKRRYLEESLERELARAGREARPLALFMLELDHLKRFNDAYGHEAGDAALRALGLVVRRSLRVGDIACRFGADVFTVALPGAAPEQAREWAERLVCLVSAMTVQDGGRVLPAVTISMGLACYPENGKDVATLVQAAGLALYEAKHAKRERQAVGTGPGPEKRQAGA